MTLPPPGMRDAMARARVGDDVYGEDPTVNRLEMRACELVGKAAALLVPSGTMANLLALLSHCGRAQKVLVGDQSDIWLWEAGGAAALGGLVYHPVPTKANGELALEDLEAAIADEEDPQCARIGLVCLEDTHCMAGGRVLSLEYLCEVGSFARQEGWGVHLDGARLFNAAIASGVDPRQIAGTADTVSFCLSKGLAAPIGSILSGPSDLIARARRLRKMVGGGMRQAGFVAAAGLFALEEMIGRLEEDHEHARLFAAGIAQVPGIELLAGAPETNIVFWRLEDPAITVGSFLGVLEGEGVLAGELGKGRLRAVTHYGIRREDVERAVEAVGRAVAKAAPCEGLELAGLVS